MIVSTTDPISLVDIQDPESHPFVVEGDGDNALKIYFENEENRQDYLGIEMENLDDDSESILDDPV